MLELLNRLGTGRVAAMVVVAALILGFLGFVVFRINTPQLAPLYTGLELNDSSAMVTALQSMNVPFELRGDGETILVPRDQITRLRMTLAEDGLPARGQVGYEIFDEQSSLGATSFVQNINQLRALEGELARTIMSLSRIRSARVHLVLPERELFQRERKDPTASIVVGVRGELSAGEVRSIQHLVSSAIEGLTPNAVSIVDDSGRLLASGAGNQEGSAIAGEVEERTLGVENRLRQRVEDLLANIVGTGRARVQVSAELDLNRSTTTSETFDPDGQVVRSSQTRELSDNATTPGVDGAVTVANELPGATENSGSTSGVQQASATTEETTNFEISKTTQTDVNEAGGVRRLSVAVVVDGIYTQDAAGVSAYEPRSDAEMAQIDALVKSAVGFDANRGDQVEVANLQFAARPDLNPDIGSEPGLFDFTRDDLMNMAQMAVTLLISVAFLFFILRPLLRRVLEPEDAPLELPQNTQIPSGPAALVASKAEAAANPDTGPAIPNQAPWVDKARQLGASQAATVKSVGDVVEDSPKQAALVVRDWLNQGAA